MARFPMRIVLAVIAAALLGLVLAGCGGGSTSSAGQESETVAEVETATTTTETESVDEAEPETDETETTASESAGGTDASGPAPAPGTGRLVLDDGRVFAIALTECEFRPDGTFEINGTSDEGATFDMTQFFLNDEWSQSDASIEFPNNDQVYVIVSRATEGAEPATVDGKTVVWTQTFRELDESANRHVYTGEGALQLTCV